MIEGDLIAAADWKSAESGRQAAEAIPGVGWHLAPESHVARQSRMGQAENLFVLALLFERSIDVLVAKEHKKNRPKDRHEKYQQAPRHGRRPSRRAGR